jgi:NRPS condensation-like uncharacterized protein
MTLAAEPEITSETTAEGALETTPFTEADAGFAYLARPGRSLCIQAEIHLAGRMDPERLSRAARIACERHPMARAQRAPFQKGDRFYRWEIQREVVPDLEIVECVEEGDLARARARLLDDAPSLDAAPLFTLALLRRAQGDALIVTISHALSDGLGVWRILTSLLRAYSNLEDPLPAVDPLRARELRPLVVPDSRRERLRRLSRLPALLAAGSRPGRMAPQSAEGEDEGEDVCLLSLDAQETAALGKRRGEEATINDVMLAGLVLAIRRWNAQHGERPAKVCLTVPVNIRPRALWDQIPGNFAAGFVVAIPKGQSDDPDELLKAVTRRTQKAKRDHSASAMFDMFLGLLRLMPIERKRRVGSDKPQVAERIQDTAVFSNLGRLEFPDLGEQAGAVQGLWMSPPAGFTRGVAIAVLSLGECLHFSLRYQRRHFDEEAARAFVEIYRGVLLAEGDDQMGS